jgi:hypothetical protein
VLVILAVYATLIAGILPLEPDTRVRDLRLALLGGTVFCVVMWIVASVRAPRTDTVVLDKSKRREHRPSRLLPVVLAFALPLASGAALVQAVGPDGEHGRWVSEVYAAGGGVYEVPIDTVLSEPRTTGANINEVDEYAADLTVTPQFDNGSRKVTLQGATTVGKPAKGDTVSVVYAPSRPDLGVRPHGRASTSFFALLWIWSVTLFAGAFATAPFAMLKDKIDSARRLRADVHGPAAAILLAGVCLLLPGAFFNTSTWAGWLLALAAASTPWLALTWMLKRR